jgi:hypothetical protein
VLRENWQSREALDEADAFFTDDSKFSLTLFGAFVFWQRVASKVDLIES